MPNLRTVYEGAAPPQDTRKGSGRYFTNYADGAEVSRAAIDEALRAGLLVPLYPDLPGGCWVSKRLMEEAIQA